MIRNLLLLPERHPGRTLAALGAAFVAAYVVALVVLKKPDGRIVLGDAVHYYVYLRSAVFDGDLRFRNEYVRLYGLRGGEADTEWVYQPTSTGHTRNLMSIGPALTWAPLYLVVTAGAAGWSTLSGAPPPDGFGRVFQAAAGVSGIVAATAGIYLSYLATARLFGARLAVGSAIVVWLGSSAIYYTLVSPTYSHAASILAVGLFLYVWVTSLGLRTPARYARVGACAGLAALVRWQDAVLLVIPAIEALIIAIRAARAHHDRVGVYRDAIVALVACAAGAAIAFLPQVIVWRTLYGSLLLVPQGQSFLDWTSPSLWNVLFSDKHGLFSWTPVAALCVAGLLWLLRDRPLIGGPLLAAFALSWYVNAAVADWWAGEAYGARRFVSCVPIFVVGLAALAKPLSHRPGLLFGGGLAIVVMNGLLLLQYQTFMHGLRDLVPYPAGLYGLWLARFVVPFSLVRWWMGS
jgi:hypothetical protein